MQKGEIAAKANAILIDLSGEKRNVKIDALIELCRGALKSCECEIAPDIREVLVLIKILCKG